MKVTLQSIADKLGVTKQAVWQKTKKGRAYRQTEKFKAYRRAYLKTDKYKSWWKNYRKTDKYKNWAKSYFQSDKYKKYKRIYNKNYYRFKSSKNK